MRKGRLSRTEKFALANFRNALRVFALAKMDYKIRRGDFDPFIVNFLEGLSMEINFSIQLTPNDIIVMRTLAGGKINKKIMKKVERLWIEE